MASLNAANLAALQYYLLQKLRVKLDWYNMLTQLKTIQNHYRCTTNYVIVFIIIPQDFHLPAFHYGLP